MQNVRVERVKEQVEPSPVNYVLSDDENLASHCTDRL